MVDLMLTLVLPAAAGLALGALYFVGLHLTTRAMPQARQPALLFLASLVCRMALLLAGVWFISAGDWRRMLATLVGIVVARVLVLHSVQRAGGANA